MYEDPGIVIVLRKHIFKNVPSSRTYDLLSRPWSTPLPQPYLASRSFLDKCALHFPIILWFAQGKLFQLDGFYQMLVGSE